MRIIRTKEEYLASPLSKDEIAALREQQRRWVSTEKTLSLSFIIGIVIIPLILISIYGNWVTLLVGMGVELIGYMWFKYQIPKILESKYPCSVIIDDEEVVKPYCDGLANDVLISKDVTQKVFEEKLDLLKRLPVRFEKRLLDGNT